MAAVTISWPRPARLEFGHQDVGDAVGVVQGFLQARGRVGLPRPQDVGLPLHVRAEAEIFDSEVAVEEVARLDDAVQASPYFGRVFLGAG